MSTSSSSDLGFKKLGETNWNSWSADMKAKLMEKKVYGVVSGKVTAATPGVDAYSLYIMQEQAAGIMWSGLEESNKSIVKEQMENPKLMWDLLKQHHQQQLPTTRFLAYEVLLSITKLDDESLMALTTRIKDALSAIMDATPDSFTLDKLYTDLACMALIRALPVEEYSQFRSMLLMRKEITLQDLQDACRVEQDNRKPSAAAANFVKASSSFKSTPLLVSVCCSTLFLSSYYVRNSLLLHFAFH